MQSALSNGGKPLENDEHAQETSIMNHTLTVVCELIHIIHYHQLFDSQKLYEACQPPLPAA